MIVLLPINSFLLPFFLKTQSLNKKVTATISNKKSNVLDVDLVFILAILIYGTKLRRFTVFRVTPF